jgi:hypothetical protein
LRFRLKGVVSAEATLATAEDEMQVSSAASAGLLQIAHCESGDLGAVAIACRRKQQCVYGAPPTPGTDPCGQGERFAAARL